MEPLRPQCGVNEPDPAPVMTSELDIAVLGGDSDCVTSRLYIEPGVRPPVVKHGR